VKEEWTIKAHYGGKFELRVHRVNLLIFAPSTTVTLAVTV
jgi:hypothetical protein